MLDRLHGVSRQWLSHLHIFQVLHSDVLAA